MAHSDRFEGRVQIRGRGGTEWGHSIATGWEKRFAVQWAVAARSPRRRGQGSLQAFHEIARVERKELEAARAHGFAGHVHPPAQNKWGDVVRAQCRVGLVEGHKVW